MTNNHFISFKINAGLDSGSKLFNEYKGFAFPLIIFLNNENIEIDRFYGYYPPEEFLIKLNNIINNEHTYKNYFTEYTNGNKSAEVLNALASKYVDRGEDSLALSIYTELLFKSDLSLQHFHNAKFFIAKFDINYNDSHIGLINYLKKYPNTPLLQEAIYELSFYYKYNDQIELELLLYEKYINNFLTDYNFLNSYCWRMTELNNNLDDALIKINLALTLVNEQNNTYANILDTKAEILWKLNRNEEALDIINLALEIEPTNNYFNAQKEKFLDN